MAPTSGSANKFAEGERILCFHGPLIYEGKCLKFRVNPDDNFNEYLVHYAGWNKSWDEWVPETRVLKYNDSNVARQKDLHKSHKSAGLKSKSKGLKAGRPSGGRDSKHSDARSEGSVNDPDSRSSTPILDPKTRIRLGKRESPVPLADSSSDVPKKIRKSKPDHAVETEAQFINRMEVKIKLPDELKPWVVDDNVVVVKQKKLLILPAKMTVDKVLDMYLQSKKARGNEHSVNVCSEVCLGIKDYFNVMLATKLLYKEERAQYHKIAEENPDTPLTSIYGPTHLLRLFLKLGYALSYSAINEKTMTLLVATFHDFLRYLASNVAIFFSMNNYS